MTLRLSRALAAEIRAESGAAAPLECCGLLLGDRATGRIDSILPAANVAAAPTHRFEIDPAVLLAAHKQARAGGPAIMGHYHSHPGSAPIPSATDAAAAEGRGEIWLIVGEKGEIRAWRAGTAGEIHDRFTSVELLTLEPESPGAPTLQGLVPTHISSV